MKCAALAGMLLIAFAPTAGAHQASLKAKAAKAEAAAQAAAAREKQKLEDSRGQAATEGAKVEKLKTRVDALEANSHATSKALDERDRKIADLQRQLDAKQHP
ncbi:hypothetical protein KR767_15125 [Luteibacter anthropi]|uniref:Peptidase M23 n=1 Tax=Luteibacter anthropi TaxID=564369 RepID=A0A7X5ZIK8_9GAMM|nr:hypothetical protein [Luteibacter anthropi]NII07008.1 hypothetical protein [Luteibacter anthropi]URX61393.1 hypothetical protein KR767_15125 [Luteibacter anthropi]